MAVWHKYKDAPGPIVLGPLNNENKYKIDSKGGLSYQWKGPWVALFGRDWVGVWNEDSAQTQRWRREVWIDVWPRTRATVAKQMLNRLEITRIAHIAHPTTGINDWVEQQNSVLSGFLKRHGTKFKLHLGLALTTRVTTCKLEGKIQVKNKL